MKQRMGPIWAFLPIQRIDDEKREIEAYGFVNEKVEGQDLALTRGAMEAASSDYMQWANIREMHVPSAVGVAQTLEWDDTGAHMVCRVVDDDAWTKVKEGVYKGLSVGVNPIVVRGKKVEKCRWIETSLVDRPRDPDARITLVRMQGAEDETDVEVIDERATTARIALPASWTDEQVEAFRAEWQEALQSDSPAAVRLLEIPIARAEETAPEIPSDTHYDCGSGYGCCGHTTRGGAQECRERRAKAIDQEIEWLNGRIREMQARRAEQATLARAQGITIPDPDEQSVIERAEAAETELTRVQAAHSEQSERLRAAEERLERLARQPAPMAKPIVRFPSAATREMLVNRGEGTDVVVETLQAEYKRLETAIEAEKDASKRQEGIQRMLLLSAQIASLGGNV